jgi:hypothetical protein
MATNYTFLIPPHQNRRQLIRRATRPTIRWFRQKDQWQVDERDAAAVDAQISLSFESC